MKSGLGTNRPSIISRMTAEFQYPPIRTEFLDEPMEAPCPDCREPTLTTKIWRNYTEDWQPTDDIESLDRCDSCFAKRQAKIAEHDAEVARREVEAEARRQEIFARARAATPSERQAELELGLN